MTKIDIFSGFLGAGKTTLIKKLLQEAMDASKVVLIENEFGEIGIDGGFLKEAGVEIKEMNQGCICCSLVGDFGASLAEVLEKYQPERILIEPSGVGKLSDVMKAVQDIDSDVEVTLNSAVVVVDANKCKMYAKNFGEFFLNQIEHAGTIILSRTAGISESKLATAIEIIREHNDKATIITTPWDELDGKQILETIEKAKDLEAELMAEVAHHHEHGEHCTCGCHDHEHSHQDHEEHEHEHHHHHEHDEHCTCGCHEHEHEHHHHHEHDEHCTCGCHEHHHEHGHDHHGHHHADEVFTSWGVETAKVYSQAQIEEILTALDNGEYGMILRAKGIVAATDGSWLHFDYVPGEIDIRRGAADITGRLCVIGSRLDKAAVAALFGV